MIQETSWDEIRAAGLLWWINRGLHVFGWAIVVEMTDDGTRVRRAYPARCSFRGFDEATETEGFRKVTAHLETELPRLKRESQ